MNVMSIVQVAGMMLFRLNLRAGLLVLVTIALLFMILWGHCGDFGGLSRPSEYTCL